MKKVLMMIVCTALTGACWPEPPCTPNETRCTGSFVEVCDEGGGWQNANDCGAIAGDGVEPWLCCWAPQDDLGPAAHACMPRDYCAEVAQ